METTPKSLPWKSVYKLMIGSIVPRPIGWISTLSPDGKANLAPFSYFSPAGSNPPHVMFSPSIRDTDGAEKDTLRNLRVTDEFVVNIVNEALADAMILTSTELPADIDEFEYANLTKSAAAVVKPPRVAESLIHLECLVTHIIDLGNQPGSGSIVIGRVVHIHVSDDVLFDGDKIDLNALAPVGRLAGASYCRIRDVFEMPRPPSQVKPVNIA